MAATICLRPVTLTFDLEVGVGVACDLGYPCAKFRLPTPFGLRVRADVRDIRRQTPITALCPLGGGIINGPVLVEAVTVWCSVLWRVAVLWRPAIIRRTPGLIISIMFAK